MVERLKGVKDEENKRGCRRTLSHKSRQAAFNHGHCAGLI